jgi:hypothetical protein
MVYFLQQENMSSLWRPFGSQWLQQRYKKKMTRKKCARPDWAKMASFRSAESFSRRWNCEQRWCAGQAQYQLTPVVFLLNCTNNKLRPSKKNSTVLFWSSLAAGQSGGQCFCYAPWIPWMGALLFLTLKPFQNLNILVFQRKRCLNKALIVLKITFFYIF